MTIKKLGQFMMVSATEARVREDALLEALKSFGSELPIDGWCFCAEDWHELEHSPKCEELNKLVQEIEETR